MLLFNDVELLDFAGPLEVFGAANYLKGNELFSIHTVGLSKEVSVSKGLLKVSTDVLLNDKSFDLLLIPGGIGTRTIITDARVLDSIDQSIAKSKLVASICTGALILAKLGHLHNLEVCSHHLSFDLFKDIDDTIIINKEARYVDNGRFITSAGVSAGIDMAFYIIKKYFSQHLAEETRKYIEYFPENLDQ